MSFQDLQKELLSLLHQHGVNTELLAGLPGWRFALWRDGVTVGCRCQVCL